MSNSMTNTENVINEIIRIAGQKYPDRAFAASLLYDKLSKLPKTYYLVEEINYSLKRQKEFIKNQIFIVLKVVVNAAETLNQIF